MLLVRMVIFHGPCPRCLLRQQNPDHWAQRADPSPDLHCDSALRRPSTPRWKRAAHCPDGILAGQRNPVRLAQPADLSTDTASQALALHRSSSLARSLLGLPLSALPAVLRLGAVASSLIRLLALVPCSLFFLEGAETSRSLSQVAEHGDLPERGPSPPTRGPTASHWKHRPAEGPPGSVRRTSWCCACATRRTVTRWWCSQTYCEHCGSLPRCGDPATALAGRSSLRAAGATLETERSASFDISK